MRPLSRRPGGGGPEIVGQVAAFGGFDPDTLFGPSVVPRAERTAVPPGRRGYCPRGWILLNSGTPVVRFSMQMPNRDDQDLGRSHRIDDAVWKALKLAAPDFTAQILPSHGECFDPFHRLPRLVTEVITQPSPFRVVMSDRICQFAAGGQQEARPQACFPRSANT